MQPSLKERIRTLASEFNCSLIGFADGKTLAEGPPSADPSYLMPSSRSVISFALPLNSDAVDAFLTKSSWLDHCRDRKELGQKVYRLGDAVAAELQAAGYQALNVDLNNNYRPEPGAADVTEQTEFHPEFSHRYAAVAAGIGRLGWSGNLMTREHGALVELGTVLTDAKIPSDVPLTDAEHPCDRCKMCALVCPVGMVDPKASTTVRIAGIIETISAKRPNTCCWIGCTGYEGLSSSGGWSNFSPYTLSRPLPVDKAALDALCIRLQKADPQMKAGENSFDDYRKAIFAPGWLYSTVCGFCRSVCASDRKRRLARRSMIAGSGRCALAMDGRHVQAEEKTLRIETPFGLTVVVNEADYGLNAPEPEGGGSPLDREVLKFLKERRARR